MAKKYRTKSGKVEEKLPGINATVSPSEKVQIAMAGGANTLGDVQTILGQQGKRNNLKGQGAKHFVSFDIYDDMAEGGYTGPGSPAATSEDIGYDYSSEGDWTLPSEGGRGPAELTNSEISGVAQFEFDKKTTGITRGPVSLAVKKDLTRRGMYTTQRSVLRNEAGKELKKDDESPVIGPSPLEPGGKAYDKEKHQPDYTDYSDPEVWRAKDEKNWLKSFGEKGPSVLDYGKREIDKLNPYTIPGHLNIDYMRKLNLASGALSLATMPVSPITGAAGVIKSMGMEAFYKSFQIPAPKDQIPMPFMTSKEAEDYADLYAPPTPTPTPDEGGTEKPACPRGSTKSASGICLPITSNNTTLAVVNEKDTRATRAQLRGQATRRA
jgi:hypothetical protein